MTIPTRDIAAIRSFNRFYTQRIGAVSDAFLDSEWTLSEARVLYEIAHGDDPTASEIATALTLDPGYVSRVLKRFRNGGIVRRTRSPDDGRLFVLGLTAKGKRLLKKLDAASEQRIADVVSGLDADGRRELVDAMRRIEDALSDDVERKPTVTYRGHEVGDLGWIVERHGRLYHASHGWDSTFEAFVADIVGRLGRDFDPTCERTWIAEVDGRRAGAIALVRHSKTIGQLRLLFVEPWARGLGIGARLVSECVGQARHFGYRKMILFTVHGLPSARRLYEAEGFELVEEHAARLWGKDELEQKWELTL